MQVLLALFANNFFALANYIVIALILYQIGYKQHFKMLIPQSAHFLWLILASVSYFVISEYNGYKLSTSAISLRYIAPIVLFYTGFIRGKTSYSTVKNDMLIMGFASCVHGAVNLFQNRSVDILSLHGRYYVDVYSGVVSAIVQNLMFVFTTPLLFYFFIIEKNKKVKMLGIFCGLIGLYGTFANASRTLLLITGIVSLLSYFMYLLSSKRVDISVFRFVASVCLIIIIGIIIVCINPSFIENWFLNTALGQRGASRSLTEDLRWKYAGDIIKMLPQYPLGNVPYSNYAHNFWIDIAKETGFIPSTLYIIFTINALAAAVRYAHKNLNNIERAVFVIGTVVSCFIVFFVQPLLEGSPIIFSMFCYFIGGIDSLSFAENRINNYQIM